MAGPGRRSCTDFLFTLLLVGAYAVLATVVGQSYHEENIDFLENLAYGKNWDGKRCGRDKGLEAFPLTYFTVPVGTPNTTTTDRKLLMRSLFPVCTAKCPEPNPNGIVAAYNRSEPSLCDEPSVKAGLCTWYGGEANRARNYCIDETLLEDDSGIAIEDIVADIKASAGFIAVWSLFAIFVGFLVLWIIKMCSAVFIWAIILAMLGLFTALGYYMLKNAPDAAQRLGWDEDSIQRGAYVVFGIDGVLALFVICYCHSINVASKILRTAADFMVDVWPAMLWPIFSFALQFVAVVAFADFATFVATSGITATTAKEKRHVCTVDKEYLDPFCVDFSIPEQAAGALVFVIFMYFWTAALIHAISVFTMSYTAGHWYYWEHNDEGNKLSPTRQCHLIALLIKGFCTSLLQIGSLAFGSLVIAISQLIVMLCKWAKAYEERTTDNPVVKCFHKVSTCVAQCVDRTARLVTDSAYIQMALKGKGFCGSCGDSLKLWIDHAGLLAIVGSCSAVFRFLGPLVVMGVTGFASWICLTQAHLPKILIAHPLSTPSAPFAVILLLAYLAGDIMMHPYAVVSTTVVHAYCMDKDAATIAAQHGGVRSYRHVPKNLVAFVDDHAL